MSCKDLTGPARIRIVADGFDSGILESIGNVAVQPVNNVIEARQSGVGLHKRRQNAYASGVLNDDGELSLIALSLICDATVTVQFQNGRNYVLRDAAFTGDVMGNSETGQIAFRFESKYKAEELLRGA